MKENKIPDKLVVWFGVNEDGKLFLFTSEPHREGNHWEGDFFLNSIIHENIKSMLNGSKYSWKDEPQCLEFKLNIQP